MKHLTVSVFCMMSLSLFGIVALAADERPCADDVAKFCKDVHPGGGRLAKCLKEHETELSSACKSRREELRMKVREAAKACHDDIEQFCGNVKPGRGRIVRCLKEHESKLSTECREKIERRK